MFKKIYEKISEYFLDIANCGMYLGGIIESPYRNIGIQSTESSEYFVLDHIFKNYIEIRPNDIIVDVGCGMGRVILWLISQGHENKIIGFEINDKVARITHTNFKKNKNVSILNSDITENFVYNATIFYLFNPFERDHMVKFKRKLDQNKNKKYTIIYYNCLHLDVFEDDPTYLIREFKMFSNWPYTAIIYAIPNNSDNQL